MSWHFAERFLPLSSPGFPWRGLERAEGCGCVKTGGRQRSWDLGSIVTVILGRAEASRPGRKVNSSSSGLSCPWFVS